MEGNGLGHGHTNRQWDIGTGRKGQEHGQEHGQDRERGTEGQMDRDRTGTGHDRDRGTVTGIVRLGQRKGHRQGQIDRGRGTGTATDRQYPGTGNRD